jgi:hypothetical protein
MELDRERIRDIFTRLGAALTKPTTLCLIGSTPAIMAGQIERRTQDIDVWQPNSDFDQGDFANACKAVGVLFDPKQELDPSAVYVQVVEPGIVALPRVFAPQIIARFGNLTLAMPPPAVIAASKLVRANPRDIEDITWWMAHRALGIDEIATAVRGLPTAIDRETASENLVYVRVIGNR